VLRRLGAGVQVLTVVGAAADTDSREIGQRSEGVACAPVARSVESSLGIAVRTRRDPRRGVGLLERAARRLAPELAVIEAGTGMNMAGVENLAFEVLGATAAALGLLALALAMVGLHGVLSYLVAQRTRELGIRRALGATTRRIVRRMPGEDLQPVAEGLVVGLAVADLAVMATRPAFERALPDMDLVLLVVVPLPFVAAALITSVLPARRAARTAPAETIGRSYLKPAGRAWSLSAEVPSAANPGLAGCPAGTGEGIRFASAVTPGSRGAVCGLDGG
jgi:putative ABC transport system permease protein